MSKEKIKVYLYTRVSKIEVTMEPDEESNYTPEEKATYQERIHRDKCSSLPGCKGDTGGYQKAAG
ncbi:MAG: hypothetical protein BHV92_01180 [Clostridiales bacterium 45_37]|nr:MAG: hypothetical protein BHV92_01180 [Clostridiales bacterium 45_37]